MAANERKSKPYGTIKFESIDAYHAACSTLAQAKLQELRNIIREVAPNVTEGIRYNIPTFMGKKNLVHYAAYPKHIGFYPSPAAILKFAEKLEDYITSKGAIQFPLDKPLPAKLIQEMVQFRIEEDALQGQK